MKKPLTLFAAEELVIARYATDVAALSPDHEPDAGKRRANARTYAVPVLTLGQIRGANPAPCVEGWHALLDGLGQPHVGFDPHLKVTLGDIAHINGNGKARGVEQGVEDALWCIRCLPLKEARYWAAALVAPAVERAQEQAAAAAAARAAEAVEAAEAADAVAVAADWAADAVAEAAGKAAEAARAEERLLQLAGIMRLCPPIHQSAESEAPR